VLSDEQWALIEPLLPKLKSRGRPWQNDREVVEGILWVLRTGAPWGDLPDDFPSDSTCWRRLQKWEEDGTWESLWRAFLNKLDRRGWLEWEETFADASFMPAKKGAMRLERRNAARARSAWWWSTARVFLSEQPSTRHRRRNRS
jgi:transposase